ncbi:MAG: porin family protein [Burkholderiaceae bacterium]|nr:porin family protein [Burkholderiaceae bacterium]
MTLSALRPRRIPPVLSTLLLGATLAGPLRAQTTTIGDQLYLGLSLGESHLKAGASALGLGDASETGAKLYGGLQLTPNFAIELGRARLGRFGGSSPGTADLRARANFIDGVGTLALGRGFSLLGRLGLADATLSQDGGGSDRRTGLKLGTGLQYQLSPQLALRGEWERYRLDTQAGSRSNADQYTLGVALRF